LAQTSGSPEEPNNDTNVVAENRLDILGEHWLDGFQEQVTWGVGNPHI
jgi:hypothetical protein